MTLIPSWEPCFTGDGKDDWSHNNVPKDTNINAICSLMLKCDQLYCAFLPSVPLCPVPPGLPETWFWVCSCFPVKLLIVPILLLDSELSGHSKFRLITKKCWGPGKSVLEIFYRTLILGVCLPLVYLMSTAYKMQKIYIYNPTKFWNHCIKVFLINFGDLILIIHIELPSLTSLFLPITNSL